MVAAAPLLGWDPLPPLARLVALAAAVPGVQRVWTGMPESPVNRVVAFVWGAGMETRVKIAGGVSRADVRYRVTFGYRTMKAEADAETTMLGAALAFAAALEDDRTLGGTCSSARLEPAGEAPAYADLAGDEYRIYPAVVTVWLQRSFSPVTNQ